MSVAVRRVAQVIEALSESGGATAAEIAARLKISRPAVVRLLDAMEDAGIAERDTAARNFRLTLKVYVWGTRAAGRYLPVAAIREEMARLARGTERPVFYTTLEDGMVVVLERTDVAGDQLVTTPAVGRVPWHVTAHGHVLVAHTPPAVTEALLKGARGGANGASGTSEAELRQAVETARANGFATMPSQTWGHVLAAPVLDKSGYACGAIGIPIRPAEFPTDARERLVEAIKECAARCSLQLGYSSYASAI